MGRLADGRREPRWMGWCTRISSLECPIPAAACVVTLPARVPRGKRCRQARPCVPAWRSASPAVLVRPDLAAGLAAWNRLLARVQKGAETFRRVVNLASAADVGWLLGLGRMWTRGTAQQRNQVSSSYSHCSSACTSNANCIFGDCCVYPTLPTVSLAADCVRCVFATFFASL